jgi:hypothetical protein
MLDRSQKQLELRRLRKSLEKAFAKPRLVVPKLRYVDGRLIPVEEKKPPIVH